MVTARLKKGKMASQIERRIQEEEEIMERAEESQARQKFENYFCLRCDEEIKSGEEIITEKEYNGTYDKGSIRFNTMGSNDLQIYVGPKLIFEGEDLQIYVGPKLIFEGEDPGLFIPSESHRWFGEDDGTFLFKGYPVIPALPGKPDTSLIYPPLFMNERGRGFTQGVKDQGEECLSLEADIRKECKGGRKTWGASKQTNHCSKASGANLKFIWTHALSIKEQKVEFKKSLIKKMEEFQQVLLEDDEDDDLLSVNSSDMMKEDFNDGKNEVDSQKSTTFGQALDSIQFGSVSATKIHYKHPFKTDTNNVEAGLYDEDLWPIKFEGSEVKSVEVSLTESQFLKYITDDCVVDDSPLTLKELAMEDLKTAPAEVNDYKAEVKDPLEDFNVGTEGDPRILHVCAALLDEIKDWLKYLLSEFRDCFAWDYPDMPGLNRSLVEHKIPIKEDFVPYQQIPR
ncbi:hypothetical protein RHSIM_Rhsim09G0135400 [Rhododendron simsii]|uniref:Uncharacterized protein n=1 Tax=Rhododendron simsii TaxID=118357 RepID=A0A834GJ94_RHOSS|nr:hypothetical protein RHSIM_Rhsim09G0135400 [Rhododendron simsii]